MVGRRSKLTRSLRFRLSIWLGATVIAIGVVAGALSFVIALYEANEVQDNTLIQTGALITRGDVSIADRASARDRSRVDFEDRIIIRPLTSTRAQTRPPRFPPGLEPGFHTVGTAQGPYRVLVRHLTDGKQVAIAQQISVRNETAVWSALTAVLPIVFALIALLFVLTWIVHRLFGPIAQMADALDRRDESDHSPLDATGLPAELWPFFAAFNRLLSRIAKLVTAQRRFVAAAAHELRTPLASLSLQAERLARTSQEGTSQQREIDYEGVRKLQEGIKRNQRLIDQLLELSRHQALDRAPDQRCAIDAALREVVGQLLPLINAKHIDLNVRLDQSADARIAHDELVCALTNVIANAVAYVPESGQIDIRTRRSATSIGIEIEDNGPGLSDDAKAQASEPFFRAAGNTQPGSGLGLTIVREIIDKWAGTLEFEDASLFPSGLVVRIQLPLHDQN